VDVLRHQIDLAVVLPEGYEEYRPDGSEPRGDQTDSSEEISAGDQEE
jgi:ribonuclease R